MARKTRVAHVILFIWNFCVRKPTQLHHGIRFHILFWILNGLNQRIERDRTVYVNQSYVIRVCRNIVFSMWIQIGSLIACAALHQVICANQDFEIAWLGAHNAMCCCDNPCVIDDGATAKVGSFLLQGTLICSHSFLSIDSTNDSRILIWIQ